MCNIKNVDLFINVCQNLKGESFDKFKLFTTGRIKKKKEKYIIEYDNEYHDTSIIILFKIKFTSVNKFFSVYSPSVQCYVLHITQQANGKANIKTSGDINYILNLDENKKTKFNITTKDTFSNFYVNTKNVFFDIDENGGNIDFEYDLEIDDVGGMLSTKINIELKS